MLFNTALDGPPIPVIRGRFVCQVQTPFAATVVYQYSTFMQLTCRDMASWRDPVAGRRSCSSWHLSLSPPFCLCRSQSVKVAFDVAFAFRGYGSIV